MDYTKINSFNVFPLVTICVPIYGVEQYIERCARSIFEQSYSNIEYIFVNDCTKDRSMTILSSIIKEYPDRISSVKIINHERNRGLSAARNTAIENCTGDFVMNVDSDDYLEKNAVELLINKQKETGADIVSGSAVMETINGEILLKEPNYHNKEEMLLFCIQPTLDHMWRRIIRLSLYKDNYITAEEGVNVGEDLQVLPKLVYCANKVARIDDVVYHYYCMNESSYMNQKDTIFKRNIAYQDIRSLEIVEGFLKDKGNQYVATITKSKVSLLLSWLTRAYNSKDRKAYNFLASKLLAVDKPFLVSIGWDKFKVQLVNRNYVNRRIYDVINSIIHN